MNENAALNVSHRRTGGYIVDVRGWSDFSRFDPRPERPHFSNFGPPAQSEVFFFFQWEFIFVRHYAIVVFF